VAKRARMSKAGYTAFEKGKKRCFIGYNR